MLPEGKRDAVDIDVFSMENASEDDSSKPLCIVGEKTAALVDVQSIFDGMTIAVEARGAKAGSRGEVAGMPLGYEVFAWRKGRTRVVVLNRLSEVNGKAWEVNEVCMRTRACVSVPVHFDDSS